MELKDKLEIFKQKGWKYDSITGNIINTKNRICSAQSQGYILCATSHYGQRIQVGAHQLAWFLYHNQVPIEIDHIDRDTMNNKIDNLRNVTHQQNMFNKNVNGYGKISNSFQASISAFGRKIYLGTFKTEQEAKKAYLDAKKIYHNI